MEPCLPVSPTPSAQSLAAYPTTRGKLSRAHARVDRELRMSPAEERIKMTFISSDWMTRPCMRPVWGLFAGCALCLPLAATVGQNTLNPGTATITAESGPINGALDSGETVTVALPIVNNGDPGATTTNLVATLQAVGGVSSPSGPQNYGAVAQGATRRAAIYVYGHRRVRRVRLYHAAAAGRRHEFRHHRLQASHLYGAKRRDVFERQHRRADSRREYRRHSDLCRRCRRRRRRQRSHPPEPHVRR